MRTFIAIIGAMLFVTPAWSQLPPEGPERDKLRDQTLKNWETALGQVKCLDAECVRTSVNKVFQTNEIDRGHIKIFKSDEKDAPLRLSLKLVSADNPERYEHLIISGTTLYNMAPIGKVITVTTLPKSDDGLMPGLPFGLKVGQVLARYKVDLVSTTPEQDKHYWCLRIEPKLAADKANFSRAQVTLTKSTNLLRQIAYQQANGNVVTWDLPRVDTSVRLGAADFEPPQPQAGWKINRVP